LMYFLFMQNMLIFNWLFVHENAKPVKMAQTVFEQHWSYRRQAFTEP